MNTLENDPNKLFSIQDIVEMAAENVPPLIDADQKEELISLYANIAPSHWLIKRLNEAQTFFSVKDLRLFAILLYEHSYSVQQNAITPGGLITHYLRSSNMRIALGQKLEVISTMENSMDSVKRDALFEIMWEWFNNSSAASDSSSADFYALFTVFLSKVTKVFRPDFFKIRNRESFKVVMQEGFDYLYEFRNIFLLPESLLQRFISSYDIISQSALLSKQGTYNLPKGEGFNNAIRDLVAIRLDPEYSSFYA